MNFRACARRPEPSVTVSVVLIVIVLWAEAAQAQASRPSPTPGAAAGPLDAVTLEQAQRAFYNGDYDRSAAVTDALCAAGADNLEACELRTASLLFQMKRALGDMEAKDKTNAWKQCAVCPPLMTAFLADTRRAQALARATLTAHPDDEDALFFLGKVDLNYVWLQLGTLGKKTGWDEYWEARKSLDRVLQKNPAHVRARVARAWVDYIVGSTVPRGVRWFLGGGNKKRGLLAVREVAERGSGDKSFDQVEAMFALWDMQVREREVAGAVATARALARDFPENRELRKFLSIHDPTALVRNPNPPGAP